MKTAMTVQAVGVWGFVPALAQTEEIVKDGVHRADKLKGKYVWYEGLLLAISFILLLLGLLPFKEEHAAGRSSV